MKFKYSLLAVALFILFSVRAQPYIYMAGSGMGKIVMIDKATSSVLWEYPFEKGWECNCIDINAQGEILIAYKTGARLITQEKALVWDFPIDQGELQTAFVLPHGGYLLGICDSISRIVELDSTGQLTNIISFVTGIDNYHQQFRQIKKTAAGTYLVPLFARKTIWELNAAGQQINEYPLADPPFSTLELPSGNLWVSCGDGKTYQEIDRKSRQTLKSVSSETLPQGIQIQYAAQVYPLPNGHHILCNWNGHYKKGEEAQYPHLIELSDSGEVVWLYNDHTAVSRVSSICIRRQ